MTTIIKKTEVGPFGRKLNFYFVYIDGQFIVAFRNRMDAMAFVKNQEVAQ